MNAVFDVLILLLELYRWVLLAVVLLSWLNPDPYNPVVRFLRAVTDPILLPFRRLLMPLTMQLRIDFSPILAFLLIGMLQSVLRRVQFGGLRPEVVLWSLVDGVIIFAGAVVIFLVVFLAGRVLIEATNADRWNPIVRFVYMVTDPVVYRLRLPARRGRFDYRPAVAAGGLFVVYLLLQTLRTLIP